MGKVKNGKCDGRAEGADTAKALSFEVKLKAVDPALASLFASSAGPVKAPPRVHSNAPPGHGRIPRRGEGDSSSDAEPIAENEDEELSELDESIQSSSDHSGAEESAIERLTTGEVRERKRKRKDDDGDLEDSYMRRIAQEEAKEKARRKEEGSRKRQKSHGDTPEGGSLSSVDVPGADRATLDHETPQHESLGPSKDSTEIEKASRTVFLSNVSTLAITSKSAKKKLIGHLSSFLPLPVKTGEDEATHKVESLRFRSTAFSSAVLPKRAAFARKELMDATTKSTNAYAVYTTAVAAREAVKRINGTVVLDRHMRVDGVAHPAKIDHRRCVFVGNLGFVDDESLMDAAEEGEGKRKRSKVPSDVEEGLWRQFGKAGKVESVRVVRDPKTRVGKGIAYVQFEDANAVEAALLYNEKKFPPALPRILRVTRAKSLQKTWSKANATATARPAHGKPNRIYVAKPSSEVQSFKGRAGKLLGRAGAAKVAAGDQGHGAGRRETPGVAKSPEQVVFEGYRASRNAGRSGLKTGASGKKKGKPKTRSSKRGTAWKAAEGRGK